MRIYAFHSFHLTRGIIVTVTVTASVLPMLMLKWNEQIQMQSKELFNNAPTMANGKLVLALELRAQNYKNTLHFRLYKFNVVDSLWLRFELYVVTSTFQFILVLPNIFTMFASFFFSLCSLLVVLHSFNVFFSIIIFVCCNLQQQPRQQLFFKQIVVSIPVKCIARNHRRKKTQKHTHTFVHMIGNFLLVLFQFKFQVLILI